MAILTKELAFIQFLNQGFHGPQENLGYIYLFI